MPIKRTVRKVSHRLELESGCVLVAEFDGECVALASAGGSAPFGLDHLDWLIDSLVQIRTEAALAHRRSVAELQLLQSKEPLSVPEKVREFFNG